MDENQTYLPMDLLVEADTDAAEQEAVSFAAPTCSSRVDMLLVDTTSTYFECDTEDPGARTPAGHTRPGSAGTGTTRNLAVICRRSSSAWR
jgi:hypothetical protein